MHVQHCKGVFSHVYSGEINTLPPHMRKLAGVIPDFLKLARAESTVKKYEYGFKAWKRWAVANGMPLSFPLSPLHCALYLLTLVQQSHTVSPVQSAFYSLRHAHVVVGLPSPTESTLVVNVLEAAKRKLAKSVVKKEPFSIETLEKMVKSVGDNPSLYSMITVSMCLIAYAGFLRSAELLCITRDDVIFCQAYMLVFIQKSKTDIYIDGAWLVIGRTSTDLCPVMWLEGYLNKGKYS